MATDHAALTIVQYCAAAIEVLGVEHGSPDGRGSVVELNEILAAMQRLPRVP